MVPFPRHCHILIINKQDSRSGIPGSPGDVQDFVTGSPDDPLKVPNKNRIKFVSAMISFMIQSLAVLNSFRTWSLVMLRSLSPFAALAIHMVCPEKKKK